MRKVYRTQPIISLQGITKSFQDGDQVTNVLRGVNLDVREGEFVAVFGESGCGKSTLLNIIGGLLPPSDGLFLFDGNDFSHADDKTLTMYHRHTVGFVFQSYNLMPTLTAKERSSFSRNQRHTEK